MACSSRSLITCGVTGAAVIAWRCRGVGRDGLETAEGPLLTGGNLPTRSQARRRVSWRSRHHVFMTLYASSSFATGMCCLYSGDDDGKSSPRIGHRPRLVASSSSASAAASHTYIWCVDTALATGSCYVNVAAILDRTALSTNTSKDIKSFRVQTTCFNLNYNSSVTLITLYKNTL